MANTCENCKFFDGSQCHRYPPKILVIYTSFVTDQNPKYKNLQPHVEKTDWCGEFREIEY